MTKEEKNIAIALACGWKRGVVQSESGKPDKIVDERWAWTPPDGWLNGDSKSARAHRNDRESGVLSPPDYVGSLEAMYEAEMTLSDVQWFSYGEQLQEACSYYCVGVVSDYRRKLKSLAKIAHAKSYHRADAFIAALNLNPNKNHD